MLKQELGATSDGQNFVGFRKGFLLKCGQHKCYVLCYAILARLLFSQAISFHRVL